MDNSKESNERLKVVLNNAWDKVRNKFEDGLNNTEQNLADEVEDKGQQLDKQFDNFMQKRKNCLLHGTGDEAEHTLKKVQYNLVEAFDQFKVRGKERMYAP